MLRIPAICTTLLLPVLLTAQPVREVQLTRFTMQSSAVVDLGGDSLSSPDFSARNYWFPVTVPCTVLTGLVANKVYPDPYIGMNNMLIPDANDSFNKQWGLERYSYLPGVSNPWKKPYWFRTSFVVPAGDRGKHFQLVFKGINYRAEVWLNGKKLGERAWKPFRFEMIGKAVTGMNRLKIRVANSDAGWQSQGDTIYPKGSWGLKYRTELDRLNTIRPNGLEGPVRILTTEQRQSGKTDNSR